MNPNQAFYELMVRYADFLEEMVALEDKKQAALSSYDLGRMSQSVSAQQAALMRLEGLEKQRAQAQKQSGYDGLTFEQIIERLEAEEQDRFLSVFMRFKKAISLIGQLNEKSMDIVSKNLQIIGGAVPDELMGGYDALKNKTPGAVVPLFEAKI